MSSGASAGSKARLDVFIPKKLKFQRTASGLSVDGGTRHTDTVSQTCSAPLKPQNMREAAENIMEHNTLQTVHAAKPCATDQPPDDAADNEWTTDQLRLLHHTLTQKLRLTDMRSEIMARAGSGTAVLQGSLSSESLPVRPQPDRSHCSGSGLHHKGDETACSDANKLSVTKTGTVAANAAANGDTASLNTASMSCSPQTSVAHSTECTSPGDSHPQPSASKSATQHRKGTSVSPGQQHTRQRSDKPARSQHRHKSSRRNRSPERSRRQTPEHSTRRTRQNSPARTHFRASSRLKGSIGKHAGSSASPARRTKIFASTRQSSDRLSWSAASHIGFSRSRSQMRNSQHSRVYARRHRTPSRHGSPRVGSRGNRISPTKGYLADTSFMDRQRHAEAGAPYSDRWRSHSVLPDDPELHLSPHPLPPWHSPPGSGRPSAAAPPYSHSGPQPPPWSFPSPPRSWDDLEGSMRAEPYSPPRRFNMGFTPRKRQSADYADEMRAHCWASPRDRVTSPTRRMPSPRSYFALIGHQMSSPRDSLANPSNSMPRPRGVTLRCRRSRWDRSLSPKDCSFSPRDCPLSPRDRSLSPRDRLLSPKDPSLSPRDRSYNPRDSPMSNTCVIDIICHQDSTHTCIQEDDHLHMARAAANSPMGASPGPVPGSPAHAHSDLPGQNSPHGQHGSCLSGSYQPATTSPEASNAVASHSAASCLSPAPLADGALQHGSQALKHDAQKHSQHTAAGPQAEQVELQPYSPVAKRRLDMSTADTAAQETALTDSSNTDSDSTTALCQTDLNGSFTLPDSHAVVSDASETPLTQLHDGVDAVAARRQRPRQADKSLLKKVLRKSLAKQHKDCTGVSGSEAEGASCNSSQFAFQTCAESAKAADAQRPQHAKPGEQADVRESKRAKGPQPAHPRGDSKEQAHEQTSFHDDRAKRKSKRSCHSSGAANSGGQTAVSGKPHAAAAPANSWTDDVVSAEQQWKDKQTWAETLGSSEGPLELDALCWFYLDPSGKARGQYSLHMFMSWLHNLEKDNFEQELAAFRETTVWRANMTTRVPLMALLYHFETLHAASWEQTTT